MEIFNAYFIFIKNWINNEIHKGTGRCGRYGNLYSLSKRFLILILLRWWSGDGPFEKEDVWLWCVGHVVNPSWWLLDPDAPPFCFRQQMRLGYELDHFFREDDVTVLVLVVVVAIRIVDLRSGRHEGRALVNLEAHNPEFPKETLCERRQNTVSVRKSEIDEQPLKSIISLVTKEKSARET